QAALFSEADLVRFFHSLAETENLLRTAAHPRYQLEVGLVKLMEMRRLEPLSDLMSRLAELEAALGGGGARVAPARSQTTGAPARRAVPESSSRSTNAVSAPATRSSSTSSAATGTALAPEPQARAEEHTTTVSAGVAEAESAPSTDTSEIGRIKSVLEQRRKMFLVTVLDGASAAAIENDELCIEFSPQNRHLRDTLAKVDNIKILREVCKEITGNDLGVRFVITDGTANEDVPPSKEEVKRREKQNLRETAAKDPTVQKMLRTFRGEIVDVRRMDE